jgi:hypothetical protein
MSNIVIDIAAEFTGKKGFNQADKATDKLGKSVKKLAGAFGLALSATAVLAYGKAAVKAAAADEKAQKQLALALKNVGLERDAASAEGYIQRLQSEFGIVDDKLRPAYQALAVATKDTEETQRLLNLSLDISAATGKDLGSVTGALSRAYLGNNTALSRLGVGISKADLKTKSFYEITSTLAETFKGSATAAANTFQGSMDKLGVASANVQEIIGTGIMDALKALGDDDSVDNLGKSMEDTAERTADVIRGIGVLIAKLKEIPGMPDFGVLYDISYLSLLEKLGQKSQITPKPFTTPMTISGQVLIKQQKVLNDLIDDQAKKQAKILKDKKLQAAIDKANLALNKGSDVFDMDKIQIAAALTNQAEALGKATSASQALQIANDTARLNVKRSILALEDAIASKDEASIVAATNKLNADLKVLGALTGQSIKLSDIKSILESLKPADLINLANLDAAIAKMMELLKLQGTKTLTPTQGNTSVPSAVSTTSGISSPTAIAELMTGIGSNLKEFTILTDGIANSFQKIEDVGAFNALANMYAGGAINPFNAGSFRMAEGGSTFSSGAVGSRDVNITVNTGVGDPEAIARAVEDVIRQSYQRGTSSTGLLTL